MNNFVYLMYHKMYNWIIIFMLINPFMVFSMNNLLSLWMNMELNLVIFIVYLIMNNESNKIVDLPMKYFIINSFSSIFFLLMINLYFYMKLYLFIILMNIFMFMKLGMFPFHYWFVNMMMLIDWMSCFFLSIWQKLIPLLIIYYLKMNFLLLIYILINGFFSIVMSVNEMNLKKIMSYSSINHLGWMLINLMFNFKLFLIYYTIYLMMNLLLMLNFEKLNFNYLMDFNNLNNLNMKNTKLLMILMILSFGGLPPFWGFLMKFLVIIEMVDNYMFMIIFVLIIYSLIYLYYYLRIISNFMLMNYFSLKFLLKMKQFNFKNLKLMMNLYMYIIFNFFFFMIWIFY